MLQESNLYPYQTAAVAFQCQRIASALWLDMGLGKTVITLTTIKHLIRVGYFKQSVLIIAPIRVIQIVWMQEALRWEHTKELTFSKMIGTPNQRIRALTSPANIHLINYENLGWLANMLKTYYLDRGHPVPFDGVVFDEISKMKNPTTNRVKAFLKIQPFIKWSTGLTGTPVGNGYRDLHGQFLVLDGGERLGKTANKFNTAFFRKNAEHRYQHDPYPDTEANIKRLISDITLEMSAADYNPLPDFIENDVVVSLSDSLMKKYKILEKQFFLDLETLDKLIEVPTTLAMMNKCFQFSNGAVYPVVGVSDWERVHDAKLEALADIIEEANGSPILVAYSYKSDAERIMSYFHKLKPINLTECKGEQLTNAMNKWKSGQCQLMIGHPASMGHGIDGLQHNGNIVVWFGLNWSLDLYMQLNARIRRQGQIKPVFCHRILTESTMDFLQSDKLLDKNITQVNLRKSLREYALNKGYYNQQ